MRHMTMCVGGKCPLRKKCFRYRKWPEHEDQTWMIFPPFKGDTCKEFEPIKEKAKFRSLEAIREERRLINAKKGKIR